jgi:transcriptional regulator CtsR
MDCQPYKRFGVIAVEKGFITKEQLMYALNIQASENIAEGRHRLIGQILLEEKLMTEAQIEEVMKVFDDQMLYVLSVGR